VWIEEIDALYEGQTNRILMGTSSFSCAHLCEIVHAETAEVLATYGEDFYAGTPVVTRNRFGAGHAYYVATDAEDAFLDQLVGQVLAEHGIEAPLEAPPGVEVALRERDGQQLVFVLNHTSDVAHLELPPTRSYRDLLREMPASGTLALAPRDVRILLLT
jgi:beta-galactosidase